MGEEIKQIWIYINKAKYKNLRNLNKLIREQYMDKNYCKVLKSVSNH